MLHYAARAKQFKSYGILAATKQTREPLRLEPSRFERLLRKAAQHATRRESLAALIGGGLLLTAQGGGEATDKAEGRRKRKRRQ